MSIPVLFTVPGWGVLFATIYMAFAVAGLVVGVLIQLISNHTFSLVFNIVASIPMALLLCAALYNVFIDPNGLVTWGGYD